MNDKQNSFANGDTGGLTLNEMEERMTCLVFKKHLTGNLLMLFILFHFTNCKPIRCLSKTLVIDEVVRGLFPNQSIQTMFNGIRWLVIAGLIPCVFTSQGQTLQTGQRCPDMELTEVINYPKEHLRLSDFAGKLIILDFWNHRCIACIESFPNLQSLQERFNGQIQIILVNTEGKDSTLRFLRRKRKVVLPDVPVVTKGAKLAALFSPDGYPYHVWIDENRVVRHISGGYNTTAEHIESFLNGNRIELDAVQDIRQGSLIEKSDTHTGEDIKYFSCISRCNSIDAGNAEKQVVKDGKAIRMSAFCSSITDLYIKAYREYKKYDFATSYGVAIENADSNFIRPKNPNLFDRWREKYCYSYELLLPASKAAWRYKIMQEDLERYFDIEACIEQRKIKSLVLINTGDTALRHLKSYGTFKEHFNQPDKSQNSIIRNIPFSVFVNKLRHLIVFHYPFFDESNINGNIDINLPDSVMSLKVMPELLNLYLKDYGLYLKEEDRETPVLVIKKKVTK
ncbi:MAG: TlpA family protein disulfide reductase [Chitinophagaceae bacterium]|nr:TlpA family protein disulfide reductase [Chitinophagaceae bacterium]